MWLHVGFGIDKCAVITVPIRIPVGSTDRRGVQNRGEVLKPADRRPRTDSVTVNQTDYNKPRLRTRKAPRSRFGGSRVSFQPHRRGKCNDFRAPHQGQFGRSGPPSASWDEVGKVGETQCTSTVESLRGQGSRPPWGGGCCAPDDPDRGNQASKARALVNRMQLISPAEERINKGPKIARLGTALRSRQEPKARPSTLNKGVRKWGDQRMRE